ncbi:hypothetical protein [Halalkalicoccus subterraneus]|uniref:hypothetical protein n=1 Tax=Halalkalicoccus subterraneus TaxID=2675002 RepID=UPI0013CECFA6|nr:hypothetical protein [Halalkalicoccus subterraneus]
MSRIFDTVTSSIFSEAVAVVLLAIWGPFAAHVLWARVTRPKLRIPNSAVEKKPISIETNRFDIPVKNVGRRPAYNCTVELWFYGTKVDAGEEHLFRMLTPLGWVDQYRDTEHRLENLDIRADILSERTHHVCIGSPDKVHVDFHFPSLSGLADKTRYKLIQASTDGPTDLLKERDLYFDEADDPIAAPDRVEMSRQISTQYLDEEHIEEAFLRLQADNVQPIEYTVSFKNSASDVELQRRSRRGRLLDAFRFR